MSKYCPQATERMEAIGAMRVGGMSFKAIGKVLGITHQRVHQILGDYNNMLFDRFYNGQTQRVLRKQKNRDYLDVYQFIIDYKRDNGGNSPSYREIGEACHIKCASNVKYAIDKLVHSGKIEYKGKASRSIRVLEDK